MSDPGLATLPAYEPLLRDIVNLKRVRSAGRTGSWMERSFRRGWGRILHVEDAPETASFRPAAIEETAEAILATRLADVSAPVLREHGLSAETTREIRVRGFEEAPLPDSPLRDSLREAISSKDAAGEPVRDGGESPGFVDALCEQPRAGVTAPGTSRLMLTPTESHGDHCGAVAVFGVLLAPLFGADVATTYLIGLAHHLHNATLPDAGHAGDVILGDSAGALIDAGRERAMRAIPEELHDPIHSALAHTEHVDSPEARTFHAADALDRVLEIAWHAQTADFSLDVALDEYNLVHEGFAQDWQQRVLDASIFA